MFRGMLRHLAAIVRGWKNIEPDLKTRHLGNQT